MDRWPSARFSQKQRHTFGAVLFFLTLGALLHFTGLSNPSSIVFDEVHFGKFVSSYCCSGKSFFDVHPPWAKLAIAGAVGAFTDYDGSFPFEHIGDPYNGVPIWAFRLVPALCGTLIPVAILFLILELGGSLAAASLGAFLLTFENALIIQTRVVALDGMLILTEVLCLLFYLKSERAGSVKTLLGFLALSGMAAGLSVGTKLTGLVALAFPLGIGLVRVVEQKTLSALRRQLAAIAMFLAAAISTYLVGWVIHFSLLNQPGPGDQFFIPTGAFWSDLLRLHVIMFEANANITTAHHYASQWDSWPLMFKGVYYWHIGQAKMFLFGNPVVWLGSTVGLVVATVNSHLIGTSRLSLSAPDEAATGISLWIAAGAYLIAFLPYSVISRPLFLYHYLPPLVFAVVASVLWLDRIGWVRNASVSRQSRYYFGLATVVVIGFIVVSPLSFGLEETRASAWILRAFGVDS